MRDYEYEFKIKNVDRVVDGDTVDVTIDLGFSLLHKIRIRLTGIDAPESRTRDLVEKAAGIRAKEFLIDKLEGANHLTMKTQKTGKYGRYLGEVFIDGEYNINKMMIDEGHAVEYGGGKR